MYGCIVLFPTARPIYIFNPSHPRRPIPSAEKKLHTPALCPAPTFYIYTFYNMNIFLSNGMMKAAVHPSSFPASTVSLSENDHDVFHGFHAFDEFDGYDAFEEYAEEEEEDLLFEHRIMNKSTTQPMNININTNNTNKKRRIRTALPIRALHSLDKHCWDREPDVLGKWACGAGVGCYNNSLSDAMFAPGSPPRTPPTKRLLAAARKRT